MAWESRESALPAVLSLRSFGTQPGQRGFPGCSKERRASWTHCCTGEPDAPTFFTAVPAAHSRLGQTSAGTVTIGGGRTYIAVPMGVVEDITFRKGDDPSWSALGPAALLVTLSSATFMRRFDPGYDNRLEVASPGWRTIRPLVLRHCT